MAQSPPPHDPAELGLCVRYAAAALNLDEAHLYQYPQRYNMAAQINVASITNTGTMSTFSNFARVNVHIGMSV